MKMLKQHYRFTNAETQIIFILLQPQKFPLTLKLWTIILNKSLKYISPVHVHKRIVIADGFNKNTKLKKSVDQEICKLYIYVSCFPGSFSGQKTRISDCPAQNWTPGNYVSESDNEHHFMYTHLDFLNASSSSFVSSKSFAARSQTPAFVLVQRVFFLGRCTGCIDCAWACALALTTSSCFRESSAFKLIS
jgi:hypothetical protein